MSAHTTAENTVSLLLDAGAVLPAGTTAREDADTLTARTYTHPALGDRPVVRLVPGTLGDAEDLALDFLGLVREPDVPEVGQVRRETLGFPAWALVNDPANGHHALALVKDLERLARQAKSRAGAAKQGFEELGVTLGRAVPHFLPTFYEQAARVFLQHENTTYAATFFGKARDAERVHGLTVDEERLRAVFLEFAFAGALTVKALKEYVKDLAVRLDPADAWAEFRKLTVERCAAGMPPYASLPQDARALIKAAGLDRVTEEGALVSDLIASPAVVRAPRSFWTAYRDTLVVLAGARPGLRERLLEIMPTELARGTEDHEWWLSLLADTGADTLLTGEAPWQGDAADWLTRWARYRKSGSAVPGRSAATLALVERMAPRLRADARPADIFAARWRSSADLDLLDLCAAEKIPLTTPPSDTHLPVDSWLSSRAPGARDLAATGGTPRFRRLLHRALSTLGENRDIHAVLDRLAAHPVLRDVLREWLDEAVGAFDEAEGLPAARAALSRIRPFQKAAADVNPQAVARVAAHDTAPVLGRTLRAGILDELGWPALDEALQILGSEEVRRSGRRSGDTETHLTEAWPALIVARGGKVVVVGPDKVLLDHDVRFPGKTDRWRRPQFRYTDGELLVMWWEDGTLHGYWSSRPSDVFEVTGDFLDSYWRDGDTPSIPLPGGGRATGGRTLHAGDTVVPDRHALLGDGTSYWRQGRQDQRNVWLEYDPATGTCGRASLPAFLGAAVRDGARLHQHECEVLPLQPGLEDSPFGTDGTVLGRWIRTEGEGADARTTAGTPDGRTVTMAEWNGWGGPLPLGALRLPGGAEPVVARSHRTVTLYAPGNTSAAGRLAELPTGGGGGEYAAGHRLVPPLSCWHALRPRDTSASAVLRALTDAQAAELLTATARALAERQAAADKAEKYEGPSADAVARGAVAGVLPALTDERLLTGVTGIVRTAVRHAQAARDFVSPPAERAKDRPRPAEDMYADYRPPHGDDETLQDALTGIGTYRHGWYGTARKWTALRQIRGVNHVLSGKPAEGKPLSERGHVSALDGGWYSEPLTIPQSNLDWTRTLAVLRPLAYRAAAPHLSAAHREALLLLLDTLAEGPLTAPGGGLREIVLSETSHTQPRTGQVLRKDGRTVVILGRNDVNRPDEVITWLALDHDPAGTFGAVAHFVLEQETDLTPGFPAERLTAVTRLVRDKGPAPWRPDAPAALAAAAGEGIGPLQSALLLAALPGDPDSGTLAALGLKPRQSELGRSLLRSLAKADRTALLGALLPEDPAGLWTTGPSVEEAGRIWGERLGTLVRLPEDLAAQYPYVSATSAEAVLNPLRTPWLSRTTVQRIDKEGNLVADDRAALPGEHDLTGAVHALAVLAYELPYGHPLRAALSGGLSALRHRLSDPGLLLDLGLDWTEKGGATSQQIRKAYGMPESGGTGTGTTRGLTDVCEALALRPWYGDTEHVLLRPAALTGPDDPVLGLLEGLVGPAGGSGIHTLRTLLGDVLAPAVTTDTGPGAPKGYAQDPTASVPGLVDDIAAAHALSADAAALYLQILALPDPTDRNCARWTGWKPARLKKARAELAASPLVVEAKRARAGRALFLPCGWRDLRSPALPLETWKEALYPVRGDGRVVPLTPVPDLFTRAWDRVREGDAPAFEQLTTRATRRGRRR
ncbi:hypothetical protein I3F58_26970 [Streptomyces sp. MUM 203J]|uniref:hypothetical protein n=1 Tax=Streptomyces sp. MUM 203J TaxID=2791990 RepID=UPI001F0396EB|nr:hypothetical protein [Streptomyces sp. MUM 203J]MCH0543129.1 hypothetical protein [Streptomyces sp. MUM 203J]